MDHLVSKVRIASSEGRKRKFGSLSQGNLSNKAVLSELKMTLAVVRETSATKLRKYGFNPKIKDVMDHGGKGLQRYNLT